MKNTVWNVYFTNRAKKQLDKAGVYVESIRNMIKIIMDDPYSDYPSFEKLRGSDDIYSRRINDQHRLVYQILKKEKAVKIISVWGHYDDN